MIPWGRIKVTAMLGALYAVMAWILIGVLGMDIGVLIFSVGAIVVILVLVAVVVSDVMRREHDV